MFYRRLKASLKWYPYILVNLAVFVVFNLMAWLLVVYLSFQDWDLLGPRSFVWFGNWSELFRDHMLLTALTNTMLYFLMYMPIVLSFSLIVAIILNSGIRWFRIARSSLFVPRITSVAVLAGVFWRLFSPRSDSPMNYLIGLFGIAPQDWLVDIKLALPCVVIVALWQGLGYYAIIWLAGLQTVPTELYDAAAVDGASGWSAHWHVTLPLLRPTAAFNVVVTTIQSLQLFVPIYVLTGGGPVYSTTTVVYYLYLKAFYFMEMGYASTIAIVVFGIIVIGTYLQRKILRSEEALY